MKTNKLTSTPTRFIILIALLLSPIVAGCGSDNGGAASDSVQPIPVLLDYSPTLSDAGALLYLASNPKVELLAVTLPGTGEADCAPGVRTTRSLLKIANYDDVPVGCGRDAPLIGNRDWPEEWRTEVNKWGVEMLPAVEDSPMLDAEQLMADTLAAATTPITIVAVGPLTNLGVVLTAHPELSGKIKRIVIMGGAVTVSGNVEKSPAAEWNIYIDPEAARRAIAAGIAVTFVPLDATNHVPWTERLLRRLATLDQPAARTVYQMAASRTSLAGFYFWDELAAMAAIDTNLVTIESMKVRIDDDGAVVRDPSGFAVDVAVDANANAAIEEFLRTLNGGTLEAIVRLNPVELDYMIAMNNADSRSSIALGDAYDSLANPDSDPRELAAAFIGLFVDAIEALASDVSDVIPPPALVETHADYVKFLGQFVASKNELLAALAKAEGANAGELLDDATKKSGLEDFFVNIRRTCQVLEDYSFLHDGPRPCSSAADG